MRLLATTLALFTCLSVHAAQPKLILQITVDQLRGDLLHRYENNFISGEDTGKGFKRFLDDGITYTNAHYRHSTTLTAVGHATLATGALPSQNGMAGNNWYDRATRSNMYCVADADTKVLGGEGKSASPVNLTASTFSDQLYMATNGKAKIYSVSIKDRGAVLTGGHFGKSFWYDKASGNMVTSSYFYDTFPAFAEAFNQQGLKNSWKGKEWTLTLDEEQYHNDAGNRLFQIPPKGFNSGFPHKMSADSSYYRMLSYTPFGDKLTAAFAKHVVETQALGQDEITDYLSVSFSVNDYVGHQFGPNSLEAEDNLLQLDKTLSDLFQFLDNKIGLENVLVALSADHGADAIPEYKQSRGFAAFRGNLDGTEQRLNNALKQQFDTTANLIEKVSLPGIYLDHKVITQAGLDYQQVLDTATELALTIPGVAFAINNKQIETTNFSFDPVKSKMQNAYVEGRSGDVMVAQKSSTMLSSYSAATHGSPYNYDTYVPVYFTGWKLPAQRITRRVSPEDIAVTLSATLGIGYPDKATGKVLEEVTGAE